MSSKDGILSRLTRGTAATLMRQVINIFGQIVLVPVYLKYWGSQLYGEWMLLSAAVAYLTLLDFGMQTYAVNRMNQAYARGDMGEFRKVFHTALSCSLLVSSIAGLALLAGIAAVPVEQWFQLENTAKSTALLALTAIGFQLVCSLPAGVVGGVYRAVGEYSRDVFFNNLQRGSVLAATAILLTQGAGIVAVALAQLTGLLAHIAFVQWDLRRRHPEVKIGLSGRDWALAGAFLGPSSLFFLLQISGALTLQGATLVMGGVAGAGGVAVFVSLRALANGIPQVAQALGATLWPEMTALEAKGDLRRLRATYLIASKLLLGFALSAGIFLLFTAEDIVRMWTQGRITFEPLTMAALIALQICQTWYLSSSVVLGSSNNHRQLAFCSIASSGLGLLAAALLGRSYGPSAVVWGLVTAELLISCWIIPWSACRLVRQHPAQYAIEVLGKGAVFAGTLSAALVGVSALWPMNGGPQRVLVMGAVVAFTGLATLLLFWLDSEQRGWIRGLLRVPQPWRAAATGS